MNRTFALAPMSKLIRTMTVVMFPLPLVMVAIGAATGGASGAKAALIPALLVTAIFGFIYAFWRPSRFELSERGLSIIWPIRRKEIGADEILRAHKISQQDLKQEFGTLLRVGAGGLWGGFGMLWSTRGKHVDMYVSTEKEMVIVRFRNRRPLLITPDNPRAFVEAIQSLAR